MNNQTKASTASEQAQAARDTARWTSRYARSRSFPVLVFLLLFTALWVLLSLLSYTIGWAYLEGHSTVFWLCIPALAVAVGLVVWMSVPGWGGLWLERLGWRYYDSEGRVTAASAMPRDRMKNLGLFALLLFGAALTTHLILGFAGYAPIEYMQPISALYVVPFMVFIALATRTYGQLLTPALYGLHAVLVASGVPLRFWSNPAMDVPVTAIGYMAIGALAVHAYNRYALARLKRAARAHLSNGEGA